MAKKDKFKQMQQGGGVTGSFVESLVQAATTTAAIQQKAEQEAAARQKAEQQTTTSNPSGATDASPSGSPVEGQTTLTVSHVAVRHPGENWQAVEQPKFMRLPNPQIPLNEYNLVSLYCSSLPNMTRQDFVELAIIEKLHTLGRLTDEEFATRQTEIRNRPPRGQRKGTKQTSR